jgi:hypothetical protein
MLETVLDITIKFLVFAAIVDVVLGIYIFACFRHDRRKRRRQEAELDHHVRTAPVADRRIAAMGASPPPPEPHLGKRRLP